MKTFLLGTLDLTMGFIITISIGLFMSPAVLLIVCAIAEVLA